MKKTSVFLVWCDACVVGKVAVAHSTKESVNLKTLRYCLQASVSACKHLLLIVTIKHRGELTQNNLKVKYDQHEGDL